MPWPMCRVWGWLIGIFPLPWGSWESSSGHWTWSHCQAWIRYYDHWVCSKSCLSVFTLSDLYSIFGDIVLYILSVSRPKDYPILVHSYYFCVLCIWSESHLLLLQLFKQSNFSFLHSSETLFCRLQSRCHFDQQTLLLSVFTSVLSLNPASLPFLVKMPVPLSEASDLWSHLTSRVKKAQSLNRDILRARFFDPWIWEDRCS